MAFQSATLPPCWLLACLASAQADLALPGVGAPGPTAPHNCLVPCMQFDGTTLMVV